ncbi:MAG: glycoside hydrolase family 20 zincin-like fold domain-containing protein, partial [Oscillospiraceae bacterium]
MNYKLYPPVKQIAYQSAWCDLELLHGARCNVALEQQLLDRLPNTMKPDCVPQEGAYTFSVGEPPHCAKANRAQGYLLRVAERGISISAADLAGLRYGLDTLLQLVEQAQDGRLSCLEIEDYPSVLQRGLMLDVSRGKVYTREYLLGLVDMLGRLRYNVLQLYIEHTFEFKKHPEICQGSDPLTADDILAVQARCKENGIELQANLQSLGHCNRILTRAEHQNLAESDLYWSLSTTSADALQLLEELYGEYLPLFESKWLNVCLDEPYDIGSGQSAH